MRTIYLLRTIYLCCILYILLCLILLLSSCSHHRHFLAEEEGNPGVYHELTEAEIDGKLWTFETVYVSSYTIEVSNFSEGGQP